MIDRACKAALVAAAALYMTIVAWNNLTDYDSNFQFVRHVLSMDSTFPDNRLRWRALPSPAVHQAFYAGIIAWETLCACLGWTAAFKLWGARQGGPAAERARAWATAALTVNLLLWLVAFLTVGGEWFLMWQSGTWNGQNAAFRMFAVFGLILLVVRQPDPAPLDSERAGR